MLNQAHNCTAWLMQYNYAVDYYFMNYTAHFFALILPCKVQYDKMKNHKRKKITLVLNQKKNGARLTNFCTELGASFQLPDIRPHRLNFKFLIPTYTSISRHFRITGS